MKMGKKVKKDKNKKDELDIQNNEMQQEEQLFVPNEKKPKREDNLMRIRDISRHSSSSGKLGPILPSFSHAPCSVPLLAAANPDCSIEVQWNAFSTERATMAERIFSL